MKLKTEDYYMHRGTSSNDINSIQDTSESGETITWTNVERKLIFCSDYGKYLVRFEEKYFRLSQICLSGK
jgi:hypothetical protein